MDLNQKSDETINDYTYRVQMAYKRLTDKKPAAMAAVRVTIAARLLIVRINDAGAIAGWDNARKLLEFKMCLRDKAVGWFEDLIEERINVDDWDIVKAEFLET